MYSTSMFVLHLDLIVSYFYRLVGLHVRSKSYSILFPVNINIVDKASRLLPITTVSIQYY